MKINVINVFFEFFFKSVSQNIVVWIITSFLSIGNLKTHEKIHLGDKPFHCELEGCGKSFRSNEALRRHKMSHLGTSDFSSSCKYCMYSVKYEIFILKS